MIRTHNSESRRLIDDYLARFRQSLSRLPDEQSADLVAELRTHLEETLDHVSRDEAAAVSAVLRGLGEPETYAASMMAADAPSIGGGGMTACKECGQSISQHAFICAHCGAPTGRPQAGSGIDYKSQARLFGLPLVHIATGFDPVTGRKRVAKGIIAMGDVAVGGLACGGLAVGIVAMGGVGIGLLSLGGLAIGILLALGGGAVGAIAVGGGAVGIVALGGGAVGYYAAGGGAVGAQVISAGVQDPHAIEFFRRWAPWVVESILHSGGRGG